MLDFRLLNQNNNQGATSVAENFLQRQQQERMQNKQLAQQDAQFQQQMLFNQNQAQNQLDLRKVGMAADIQQQGIENQRADQILQLQSEAQADARQQAWTKIAMQFDNDSFEKQLAMAQEMRTQDAYQFARMDAKQKQAFQQQLGEVYQQGGYQGASEFLAQNGFIGESLDMRAKGLKERELMQDVQNKMFQGERTLWDIKDQKERHEAIQFSYALGAYTDAIVGTQDPEMQAEMMYKANDVLNQKYGIDNKELLATPEGQKVFMNLMMKSRNALREELGYKANDPNIDYQTANNISAAMSGNNPFFKDFASGFRPTEQAQGPLVNVNLPGEANKAIMEADQKAIVNADAIADTATRQSQFASEIARLSEEQGSSLTKPGLPLADFRTTVATTLNGLGIDAKGVDASPAKAMEYFHKQLALSMRPAGAGAMSDAEFNTYLKASPGNEWTAESAKRAADLIDIQSSRAAAYSDFYRDYLNANQGSSAGLRSAWKKFTQDKKLVDGDGNLQWQNASSYEGYLPGASAAERSSGRASGANRQQLMNIIRGGGFQ